MVGIWTHLCLFVLVVTLATADLNGRHRSEGLDLESDESEMDDDSSEEVDAGAIAADVVAPASAPSQDRLGYESFGDLGYYKYYNYATTWCMAKQVCEEDGSELLVLNTNREAEVARTLFQRHPKLTGNDGYSWSWVGLLEKGRDGQYYTINGRPLEQTGYYQWLSPYPSNTGANNCGVIERNTALIADDPCTSERSFICERRDPLPIVEPLAPGKTKREAAAQKAPPRLGADGYEHHQQSSYKVHSFGASWCVANQICREESAQLIIINSEPEAELVKKLFARQPPFTAAKDADWVWVGVHERGKNGAFQTINGDYLEETGFARFLPSYPSRPGKGDCLVIDRKTGGLADDDCVTERGFICERHDSP